MIEFFVPGKPIPQPRPKVSTRGGFARAYVDRKHPVHAWREAVASEAQAFMAGAKMVPISTAICLDLSLILPRPKSHYGTGRNATKVKRSAPVFPAVKPDCDNLAKAIQDALDGVLWVDDALIVELQVSKRYVEGGDTPLDKAGALVRVRNARDRGAA